MEEFVFLTFFYTANLYLQPHKEDAFHTVVELDMLNLSPILTSAVQNTCLFFFMIKWLHNSRGLLMNSLKVIQLRM